MSRQRERTSVPGVFRRENRYYVAFRDAAGRQRWKSARTLAEARALRAHLISDARRGVLIEPQRIAFVDYAREWIEEFTGRTHAGIRDETRAEYRAEIEQFAVPFFGRQQLHEITPRDI